MPDPRFLKWATGLLLLSLSTGSAANCPDHESLLNEPRAGQVNDCLLAIHFALGRGQPVDEHFVLQYLERLLPVDPASRQQLAAAGPLDRNFIAIADIISLLESGRLIGRYLDFIAASSGSADETRSAGLGRLYTLQGPTLLKQLDERNSDQQATVISSLAWGLVNNFYPHINPSNYRRMIVGVHWELLDSKPDSGLQSWVESAVLDILKAN